MLEICKKLLPEINFEAFTTNSNAYSEEDTIANGIYNKFFLANVWESQEDNKRCENNLTFLRSLEAFTNVTVSLEPSQDDIWIFGYGSLMWKADFPYIDRKKGFVRGYQRRFYQNSIDHRGTHRRPGRVVTLLATCLPEDRVYGVAYRIASQHKPKVLEHLDYREKNGYVRCSIEFQEFPEEICCKFNITMYIATSENESYAGSINELKSIAEQIFCSAGPSGPNREYLFNLANIMRIFFPGVHDDHLFNLEEEVNQLIRRDEVKLLERAIKREIVSTIKKALAMSKDTGSGQTLFENLNELKAITKKPCWKERLLSDELIVHSNV